MYLCLLLKLWNWKTLDRQTQIYTAYVTVSQRTAMFLLRERIFGEAAFVVTRSVQVLNSIPNTKISLKTGET